MTAENFPDKSRRLVFEHVKSRLEKTDLHVNFTIDEVYVVSFAFVRGFWKAFLSTTLPDGMYYEVIYDNQRRETYIQSYKQWENAVVPDSEQ